MRPVLAIGSAILLLSLLPCSVANDVDSELHLEIHEAMLASDFHLLDQLGESGQIDSLARQSRLSVQGDMLEASELTKLQNILFRDWNRTSFAFEPILRYSRTDILRSTEEEVSSRVVKALRDSSQVGRNCDLRFVCSIGLLAISGYDCELSDQPKSLFVMLVEGILSEDKKQMLMDMEIELASLLFHRISVRDPRRNYRDLQFVASQLRDEDYRFDSSMITISGLLKVVDSSSRGFDYICRLGVVSSLASDSWRVGVVFGSDEEDSFSRHLQLLPICIVGDLSDRSLVDPPEVPSDINMVGKGGLTFAFLAYSSAMFDNLKYLLELGADPDAVLTEDIFPMAENKVIGVKDPAFSPRKGETILLSAALDPFRKSAYLPLILKYTKRPDARDLLNRNALHRFLYHRVQDGQIGLLKLLIDAGVDVNAKSASGNTPCHVAANRNAHLIPELVAAGADLTAKNDRGETPVDLLRRSVEEKWIFHEENARVLKELEGG